MEYLKIRNWDKWQTYRKDRGQPPWIKIHRCVMRNPEWVSLTDAERGQLVAMWLLAADHDGAIPASPDIVQKLCFLTEPPDFNKFTDLGFIEDGWRQAGVTVASNGCQRDQPKAETEKIREEKECPKFLKNSIAIKLSRLLFNQIRRNNPDHKKPNFQTWARHVNLMVRKDKRDVKSIIALIKWCQRDSFWCANILSTDKLRIQFDKLVLARKQKNPTMEDEDDVFRDLRARNQKAQAPIQSSSKQGANRDIFRDLGKRGG